MKTKKKVKKTVVKKAIKKLAPRQVKRLKAKKKSGIKRTAAKKVEFEKVQELRDVVERLPDAPLPGAQIELPKDLPAENPGREPELIPQADIFANVSVSAKEKDGMIKFSAPQERRHGVWVAVAATFSVILVAWATTLGGTAGLKVKKSFEADADLEALKAEWRGAAETLKDTLNTLGSKLESAQAKDGLSPPEEVLQAIGARVIFEASQATSTER